MEQHDILISKYHFFILRLKSTVHVNPNILSRKFADEKVVVRRRYRRMPHAVYENMETPTN